MPFGDNITEGIPYVLSNPAGATNYSGTGVAYDMAIAGLPFFIGASGGFAPIKWVIQNAKASGTYI